MPHIVGVVFSIDVKNPLSIIEQCGIERSDNAIQDFFVAYDASQFNRLTRLATRVNGYPILG